MVCPVCEVRMHTDCFIQFIGGTDRTRCPQCGFDNIYPMQMRHTNRKRAEFISKSKSYFEQVDKYISDNGHVTATENSVNLLLCMFKFYKDNKYMASSFSSLLLQIKKKLIEIIENTHMMKFAGHGEFMGLYVEIFSKPPVLLPAW